MPYTDTAAPATLPDEMAAPDASGQTASDSASGDNEQQTAAQNQKPRGGFQKRIDKLTRTIGDKDRVIDLLLAERAGRPQAGVHPDAGANAHGIQPNAADGSKPHPDNFESQAEFLEALADWKLDQRNRQQQAQEYQQRLQHHHHAVTQQFLDRQDAFRSSTPDYDDVLVDSDAPVSPALANEIRDHEHGPALMYFLASNPEVAEHLSQLAPTALAREIGRLEQQFVPSSDAPPDTAAPSISRAPKPPNPVSKSTQTSGKDPGEMNPSEYRDWRRKQFPNL